MNENKTIINWYPGHMAKTKRQLKEIGSLIDIVYEVIDSRMPISSRVEEMDEIIKDSESLLNRILLLSDSPFQRKALLLLKIKAFDIEDQHFLSEKKHSEEDLKNLRIFKKTNYIQR